MEIKTGLSGVIIVAIGAVATLSGIDSTRTAARGEFQSKDQARIAQRESTCVSSCPRATSSSSLGLPPAPARLAAIAQPFFPPPQLNLDQKKDPRSTCVDEIARGVALVSYLKVKLQLQSEQQKQLWKAVEEAAEPAIDMMTMDCLNLPDEDRSTPELDHMLAFAGDRLNSYLKLLRDVREPLKTLYGQLTAEQQALLRPRPMPFRHGGPPANPSADWRSLD